MCGCDCRLHCTSTTSAAPLTRCRASDQVQRPATDKPRDIQVAVCPTGMALYITRRGETTEEYHPFADISQWSVLEDGDAFGYWASEEDLVILQSKEVGTRACEGGRGSSVWGVLRDALSTTRVGWANPQAMPAHSHALGGWYAHAQSKHIDELVHAYVSEGLAEAAGEKEMGTRRKGGRAMSAIAGVCHGRSV